MTRTFHAGGPCRPDLHYVLPPERRINAALRLVASSAYFVVHGPHAMGKTSAMGMLAADIRAAGQHAALLVSVAPAAPFGDDVGAGEMAILESWRALAEATLAPDLLPPPWPRATPGGRIAAALRGWSRACRLPIVLFIDDVDTVGPAMLEALMRQLRAGFGFRPRAFPAAVALLGLFDVRTEALDRPGTFTPLSTQAETVPVGPFDVSDVTELFEQHQRETGQAFAPTAIKRAFELTCGQPWVVNAVARECVAIADRSRAVTPAEVERAAGILVERNETHVPSLYEQLLDERVRRVLEPILGAEPLPSLAPADVAHVESLGLVRVTDGHIAIANPIYADIVPTLLAQAMARSKQPISMDGSLDGLRKAFLAFWKQEAERLMASAPYPEIAPQLAFLVFLQLTMHGRSRITYFYEAGGGRIDLRINTGEQQFGIELKQWRDGGPHAVVEGLGQLDGFLNRNELERGWLVVLDRRSEAPSLEARLRADDARTPSGRAIVVVHA